MQLLLKLSREEPKEKNAEKINGKEYDERLKEIGLPTFEYHHTRADVIEVYKLLNDIDRTTTTILPRNGDENTREHSHKLFKQRARLSVGKHVFSHRVVSTLDNSPAIVVDAPLVRAYTVFRMRR